MFLDLHRGRGTPPFPFVHFKGVATLRSHQLYRCLTAPTDAAPGSHAQLRPGRLVQRRFSSSADTPTLPLNQMLH